jgi:poly-gamma-glutamate synthesis protein (capsule biosynthesis protein)
MIFCGRPEAAAGLGAAGFDGMGLANNHILNYGERGKEETIAWLDRAGIVPIVQGNGREFEIEGVRVGVFAFDDVSKPLDEEEVIGEIEQWKDDVEVVIVMIHWGVEYVDTPNERQQLLGRQMIDAGVDVVVGSHPHWTQSVEAYRDGVIFYSLGNFVFDQMWSDQTRLGSIALIKLKTQNSKLKTMEYELVPVKIYDYGQPRIIDSIQ